LSEEKETISVQLPRTQDKLNMYGNIRVLCMNHFSVS